MPWAGAGRGAERSAEARIAGGAAERETAVPLTMKLPPSPVEVQVPITLSQVNRSVEAHPDCRQS